MGMEPEIGSLDDTDLPTLQKQIDQSLQRWAQVEMPILQPQPESVNATIIASSEPIAIAAKGIVPDPIPLTPVASAAPSPVEVANAEPVAAVHATAGADAVTNAKTRPAKASKNDTGLAKTRQKTHLTQRQPIKLALDTGK
jgi:hypothetical protein